MRYLMGKRCLLQLYLPVSGGRQPYAWRGNGDIAGGLTIDAATGTIAGRPTAALPSTP